ncbi:MAG TPA: MaoC family dehydratase [Burkholderiales bacterium]|nr:MaoC family dehydratase [Burkholderiales bacterium]
MIEFKTISYEVVTVGEEFMSDDFLIKPEDVETFAFAVDDHDPWYCEDSPYGGTITHPVLLGNQALFMRHSKYIVPAGLHAKMQYEFLQPIRVGMRVRTHGKLIDKYEKRGRHYMVTEFATRDEESGTVLVRGQFTQMLFPKSGVHEDARKR